MWFSTLLLKGSVNGNLLMSYNAIGLVRELTLLYSILKSTIAIYWMYELQCIQCTSTKCTIATMYSMYEYIRQCMRVIPGTPSISPAMGSPSKSSCRRLDLILSDGSGIPSKSRGDTAEALSLVSSIGTPSMSAPPDTAAFSLYTSKRRVRVNTHYKLTMTTLTRELWVHILVLVQVMRWQKINYITR